MPSRRLRTDPSDDPKDTGTSPANSSSSNESFYSLAAAADPNELKYHHGVPKPWSRVDSLLQREFTREKKTGTLTLERKLDLYGDKLEELIREMEERLLCREEELLLKGRELQRIPPSNR